MVDKILLVNQKKILVPAYEILTLIIKTKFIRTTGLDNGQKIKTL